MLNLVMLKVIMPSVVMLNVVMLRVIMPSVVMLNDVILNVIMLSVIVPSVVMLNAVMLSVVMLNVVMPSVIMLRVVVRVFPHLHFGYSCSLTKCLTNFSQQAETWVEFSTLEMATCVKCTFIPLE
jgi:hypothetical protein